MTTRTTTAGFPDESPVEVRYPRSKQEEKGGRGRCPWLPGTVVEQCGPDEWYVCIEVRELAVLRDGRRAPRGTASRNLCYPCCYRDRPERFGLSRRKASQLITSVSAESNGRLPATPEGCQHTPAGRRRGLMRRAGETAVRRAAARLWPRRRARRGPPTG